MKSNGIRVCGDGTQVLSVELKDVLNCVTNGQECKWALLWLQAIGNIGDKSILDFEKEIKSSENGLLISWESLMDLSKKIDQVIEILLIGDKSETKLKRYANDEEMYSQCEYTFELIDSSYWIIHSKSDEVLSRMKNNLLGVERI